MVRKDRYHKQVRGHASERIIYHDGSSKTGTGTAAPGGTGHCQRNLLYGLFWRVLGFQLIALASILLSIFQLDRFIAPATALIVGIHFFPLARLFRVPTYYITGVLLSLLGLVALLALLLGLSIAGPSPYNWSLFVGIGVTLVLWLTAASVSRFGLRVMRQAV